MIVALAIAAGILGFNLLVNLFWIIITQELRYYGPSLDDLDAGRDIVLAAAVGWVFLVAGAVVRSATHCHRRHRPSPGPGGPGSGPVA